MCMYPHPTSSLLSVVVSPPVSLCPSVSVCPPPIAPSVYPPFPSLTHPTLKWPSLPSVCSVSWPSHNEPLPSVSLLSSPFKSPSPRPLLALDSAALAQYLLTRLFPSGPLADASTWHEAFPHPSQRPSLADDFIFLNLPLLPTHARPLLLLPPSFHQPHLLGFFFRRCRPIGVC
ncbi:hypothetical protein B0J11DRAFT_311911 [Dendryphion nanum]|uniref:Uncharacterized protein n=1 Tax=Dendryphion nanum TaxID=256645 RepID=A0A9P9IKJ9_9PLEO|nr:hypothetical protein B0J11DRAFT_311911 [Dendryphion nanum]